MFYMLYSGGCSSSHALYLQASALQCNAGVLASSSIKVNGVPADSFRPRGLAMIGSLVSADGTAPYASSVSPKSHVLSSWAGHLSAC